MLLWVGVFAVIVALPVWLWHVAPPWVSTTVVLVECVFVTWAGPRAIGIKV
jgi:hypothetical protein